MSDITVTTYTDGTSLVLTTHSPASHYGIPALRHEGCDLCPDMGPADAIPACAEPADVTEMLGVLTAGEKVRRWTKAGQRDTESLGAASAFLSQDPEGK